MPKNNGKAKPKSRSKGAYFLSLSLENIRCFGPKQTLDLSDGDGKPARWTVLLGENGTGKTTILQAIAGSMLVPTGLNSDTHREVPYLAHREEYEWYLRQRQKVATFELRLTDRFERADPQPDVVQIAIQLGGIIGWDLSNQMTLPQLAAFGYGAQRTFGSEGVDDESVSIDPIRSLFRDRAPLRNPEAWLIRIHHAMLMKLGKQQFQFDTIKNLLLEVLPDISDLRVETGHGVYPKPFVEFKTPYGWVPMRQLGYGYQSTITWLVDFTTRLFERHPESANPLAEPAVVLVDEIDLHLHPKWQRQLMTHLDGKFPNTQFIVTAHSPLIAQAAPHANLAVLRRNSDHVEIINDVDSIRNWRVDQILTSELFGLETARPPEIEQLIVERKGLLEKSALSASEQRRLKAIEEQIGQLPTGENAQEVKERDAIWKAIEFLQREKTPS
jgi:predicted ATPase